MAEFTLNDKDARKFIQKLVKNADKIGKKDPDFIGLLSPIVFRDITQHFEKEEGSAGAWQAWSKVYTEHMQRIGRDTNKILQFSGRLRQSFMPTNYRRVNEGVLWFNPAKTSSGFPYAAAHDEGGDKLPKRDFMWLSDEAKEKIEEQTLQFLEEHD